MLISSDNRKVIDTATLYLRVDSLLYFVTAMITIIRNSLQGIGDRLTPIISSGELCRKGCYNIYTCSFHGILGSYCIQGMGAYGNSNIVQLIKNPAFARGKRQ